jgi:hypothetical protein
MTVPSDLARVYGENAYAVGPDIDALAPRMRTLFHAALATAEGANRRPQGAHR